MWDYPGSPVIGRTVAGLSQECSAQELLGPHHIDYNRNNMEDSNLITLCRGCNTKANGNREYWKDHYQKKILAMENQGACQLASF